MIAGFKVEYLDAFRTAMTDVWKAELGHEQFTGRMEKAWSTLFLLITNSVSDGHRQRSSELKCTKPSLDDTVDVANLDFASESRDFDSETSA